MRRILLALAAAILLAACNQGGGNQEQGTAPAESAPNDADITFTQNMIPHHQQAIEMAKLVDLGPGGSSCTGSPTASRAASARRSPSCRAGCAAGASLRRHREGRRPR
jgi:hypothetical protein